MPPGPLPELSDDILQYIASSQWEETPVCDESDICRDAAALMCVGNSFTTALGLKLYAAVSPYLGEESPGGVHEGSTAAEMRALLKDWGLSAGGKKSDMWARIAAEAGGGSELCPVADGVRARAIELKTARTTVGKARVTFAIHAFRIRSLPALEAPAPHLANDRFQEKGSKRTYSIKDIKKIALKEHGPDPAKRAQIKAEHEGHKASNKQTRKLLEVRRKEMAAEAARRGTFSEEEARYVLRIRFIKEVWSYESAGATTGEALRKAVDALEFSCFLSMRTSFRSEMARERTEYRAAHPNAKFMEALHAYEATATRKALTAWCLRQGSLDAALTNPSLPASARGAITEAWHLANGSGGGGGGGAGAPGPSGAGAAPPPPQQQQQQGQA